MRFRLVDQAKKEFPVHRLCKVLGVSQSGYFAWKDRPASWRQRQDMILLAHVRSRRGELLRVKPMELLDTVDHRSGGTHLGLPDSPRCLHVEMTAWSRSIR